LTQLERLRLDNTPVDDLKPLMGLERLERLALSATMVFDLSP
jgi:hypothetical protein